MNFNYREELRVQHINSCLSQQPNIGGDTSQSHEVLNGNKATETTDAYINMKTTNKPDKEICFKIAKRRWH